MCTDMFYRALLNRGIIDEIKALTDKKYALCYYELRDEKEKCLLKGIVENDVETLKLILPNPGDCRLGPKEIPISSKIILEGDRRLIQFLIDSQFDTKRIDEDGNSILHLLMWNEKAMGWTTQRCNGCDTSSHLGGSHQWDLFDTLLASFPDSIEAIYFNFNHLRMTPFLIACAFGCDAMITRLLSLIDNRSIISPSIDKFIGFQGNNVFHFVLDQSSRCLIPPTRLPTVQLLIDKIPSSDRLVDAENEQGRTPLHQFSHRGIPWNGIDLMKLFFKHGASPDTRDRHRGWTYLGLAISGKNMPLVDYLLRIGFRNFFLGQEFRNTTPVFSILSSVLKGHWRSSKSESIRIIELFLAFGYDLQKELYLYTIDEKPLEFSSPEYADLRDTSGMDTEIVEALSEIRRSNQLFSLRRQCRNTIRRHLKVNADEIIKSLTCIPNRIKSYLLVEGEKSMLQISEG